MIALPSSLPLLCAGRFQIAGPDPHWIEQSIRDAARDAGSDDWWFAADIVRSLMIYLRDRFPGTVITLEELSARIRTTLEKIGFEEIGSRVRLTPPELRLSLADLAREAGGGFELQFFQLLEARLREVDSLGVRRVALTESRNGVKHLRAAKYWCRSCRELEREIAGFLRCRASGAADCQVEMRAH